MKKSILLICIICLTYTRSEANIVIERAIINEVYVDSSGAWTLELIFFNSTFHWFDSLVMQTNSGMATITSFDTIITLDPQAGSTLFDTLVLIRAENLSSALSINLQNDLVKIISYGGLAPGFYDELGLGAHPASLLTCMQEGESAVLADWYPHSSFCISLNPSLGSMNDPFSARALVSGTFYDSQGNPFPEGLLRLGGANPFSGPELVIGPGGQFSGYLPARSYGTSAYFLVPPSWYVYILAIQPMGICFRPDSSYSVDIISTTPYTGIQEEPKLKHSLLTVLPNPFTDEITFVIKSDDEGEGALFLRVTDLRGTEVYRSTIHPGERLLRWAAGGSLAPGTYVYSLEANGVLLSQGKIIHP